MIECVSCGKQYPAGTLFCNECGLYLPLFGGPLHTRPLGEEEELILPAELEVAEVSLAAEGPAALTILIKSSTRRISLTGEKKYILGRQDSSRDIYPDIDLTPDGGLDGGVSRRHACIYRQQEGFLIEDMGSANGTYLNGQRLVPHISNPLHDGDEVQVGLVRLQIRLVPGTGD